MGHELTDTETALSDQSWLIKSQGASLLPTLSELSAIAGLPKMVRGLQKQV